MRKSCILLCLLLVAFSMAACSTTDEDHVAPSDAVAQETMPPVEESADTTDYLASQAKVDAMLLAEAEAGYTLEAPLVVLNPYGNAPLSAIAVFSTEKEIGGTVTVKGKAQEDNISGSFPAARTHFVPIIGLYAGEATEVELRLEDGTVGRFQVETEMPKLNYNGFTAQMYERELYDYRCLNICCLNTNGAMAGFDSHADLRWLYTGAGADGLRVSKNGHILLFDGIKANSAGEGASMLGVDEVDFTGKIYARYVWPGGIHHDLIELSNGNLLALSDNPHKSRSMDHIVEIERGSGAVVWSLALSDLVRKDDSGCVMNTERDWSHSNGLCYDEASDTLIVSCRNQDVILGIRKAEKKLLWLLGDPVGWEYADPSLFFTPVGEDFEWHYGLHNVTFLDNGDILFFDNGLGGRVKRVNAENALADSENYSRAVIYRIDTENMTVEQVWQHGKELGSDYYASIMSGVEPLDGEGKAMLINFGTCRAESAFGNITRLRYLDQNRLVWEMEYSGGPTYRAYRICPYDLDSNGVGVEGRWLGNLGVTKELNVKAPETSVPAPEGIVVERYPFNAIRITGELRLSAEEFRRAPYVVLTSGGEPRCYGLYYTMAGIEFDKLLLLNTWISLEGLPEEPYEVMLVVNGVGMTL